MKPLKPQKQLILTVLISDFMLLKRSYDGYEMFSWYHCDFFLPRVLRALYITRVHVAKTMCVQ